MPPLVSVAQLVGHRFVREIAGWIPSYPSLSNSAMLLLKKAIPYLCSRSHWRERMWSHGLDLASHPAQHHGLLASVWSWQAPSRLSAFAPAWSSAWCLAPRCQHGFSSSFFRFLPQGHLFRERKPLSTPSLTPPCCLVSLHSVCPSRAGHTLVCFLSVTLMGWKLINRREQTGPSAWCCVPAPRAAPDTVWLYYLPVTLPHGAPPTSFLAQLLKPTSPLLKNEMFEY